MIEILFDELQLSYVTIQYLKTADNIECYKNYYDSGLLFIDQGSHFLFTGSYKQIREYTEKYKYSEVSIIIPILQAFNIIWLIEDFIRKKYGHYIDSNLPFYHKLLYEFKNFKQLIEIFEYIFKGVKISYFNGYQGIQYISFETNIKLFENCIKVYSLNLQIKYIDDQRNYYSFEDTLILNINKKCDDNNLNIKDNNNGQACANNVVDTLLNHLQNNLVYQQTDSDILTTHQIIDRIYADISSEISPSHLVYDKISFFPKKLKHSTNHCAYHHKVFENDNDRAQIFNPDMFHKYSSTIEQRTIIPTISGQIRMTKEQQNYNEKSDDTSFRSTNNVGLKINNKNDKSNSSSNSNMHGVNSYKSNNYNFNSQNILEDASLEKENEINSKHAELYYDIKATLNDNPESRTEGINIKNDKNNTDFGAINDINNDANKKPLGVDNNINNHKNKEPSKADDHINNDANRKFLEADNNINNHKNKEPSKVDDHINNDANRKSLEADSNINNHKYKEPSKVDDHINNDANSKSLEADSNINNRKNKEPSKVDDHINNDANRKSLGADSNKNNHKYNEYSIPDSQANNDADKKPLADRHTYNDAYSKAFGTDSDISSQESNELSRANNLTHNEAISEALYTDSNKNNHEYNMFSKVDSQAKIDATKKSLGADNINSHEYKEPYKADDHPKNDVYKVYSEELQMELVLHDYMINKFPNEYFEICQTKGICGITKFQEESGFKLVIKGEETIVTETVEKLSLIYQKVCNANVMKKCIQIPIVMKNNYKNLPALLKEFESKFIFEGVLSMNVIGTDQEIEDMEEKVKNFNIGARQKGEEKLSADCENIKPKVNNLNMEQKVNLITAPSSSLTTNKMMDDLNIKMYTQNIVPRIIYSEKKFDCGLNIYVARGNLIQQNTEAIVNPANAQLNHGGGAAKAIADAAGQELLKESKESIKSHGPLKVSEVRHTSAGNLSTNGVKYVLHTVGPKNHDYNDKKQMFSNLKMAFLNCFDYANSICQVKSMCVPAISSGIFGISKKDVAKQMMLAVKEFLAKYASQSPNILEDIYLINFDEETVDIVNEEFKLFLNETTRNYDTDNKSAKPWFINKFSNKDSPVDNIPKNDFPFNFFSIIPDSKNIGKFLKSKTVINKMIEEMNKKSNNFQTKYDRFEFYRDLFKKKKENFFLIRENVCFFTYVASIALNMEIILELEVSKKCQRFFPLKDFEHILKIECREFGANSLGFLAYFTNDTSNKTNYKLKSKDRNSINNIEIIEQSEISNIPSDNQPQNSKIEFFRQIFSFVYSGSVNENQQDQNFKYNISKNQPAIREDKEWSAKQVSVIKSRPESSKITNGEDNKETKKEQDKDDKNLDTKKDECIICLEEILDREELPCKHAFCRDCLISYKAKCAHSCPMCKVPFGEIVGDQPDGTISHEVQKFVHLGGYEDWDTIAISFSFPDGIQKDIHPNPGHPYKGTNRPAYLPNNLEGNQILLMLQKAFDNKVLFTIGRSNTTGMNNVVTFNDIHLKTSHSGQYGYPDPGYFQRVRAELAAKGIAPIRKH